MEYYGKILCISHNDLTYDDRPREVCGELDWSHSRYLCGRDPRLSPRDLLAPVMTVSNYKNLLHRGQINVVRPGKGLGSYALVEIATLPVRFQDRIKNKYGEMKADILKDWFGSHYRVDASARSYFTHYRFEDGSALPPDKVNEYTVNASVLESVLRVMNDTSLMRKAMGSSRSVVWSQLSGAIGYYRAEFGHTLPLSPNRFHSRVTAYRKEGYDSLVSKKFKNQSARKVSYRIERLLLSLDSQPERPFNTTVAEMYNQFVCGELEVYDPETGELFDPSDFLDRKGNPRVLSESTIANYLSTPKNKALRSKLHDTQWDFSNKYRPYHLRSLPSYALSKISLDDRDLPRPMPNGKRVKAYYAYDVVSGCVVGYAYSRVKTRDLFLDCMRNMFQTLDRNGFYMPAEVEVEHHLVESFADGLMKAGNVFPLVRWCNPGNSREKRAEHLNRAKKYGVEKRMQSGVGRWYAKLEANRPRVEKVYDEQNDTYHEKSYSYEELVADDIASIGAFNHMLHPNQKMYPGMTRWDVLCGRQNPDLRPVDKAVLYRWIGEHTETTIRQNMYCTVNHRAYRLPSPRVIEKLAPRDLRVDAYWLAGEDGTVSEVYLYQRGEYICTCGLLARYNESGAERTAADAAAYLEQSKYVSQFDKMMRDGKIRKVSVQPSGESKELERAADAAVASLHPVSPLPDDDYSEYMDVSSYGRHAVESL